MKANQSATFLLSGAGWAEGDSFLEAMTEGNMMANVLDNWVEVAQHMVVRLRTESAFLGGDECLDDAAQKLAATVASEPAAIDGSLPVVIPARYRAGDMVFSFFSTLAQFGSAENIALSELKTK